MVDGTRYCTLPASPQIVGGFPGSGFGCCGSGSFMGGGRKTVSRSFLTRPLPFSFAASGFQHSKQMSYSLPSICFCKHSFGCPHRSQTIMISSRQGRFLRSTTGNIVPKGAVLNCEHEVFGLALPPHPALPIPVGGGTHVQKATPWQPGRSLFWCPLPQGAETATSQCGGCAGRTERRLDPRYR